MRDDGFLCGEKAVMGNEIVGAGILHASSDDSVVGAVGGLANRAVYEGGFLNRG